MTHTVIVAVLLGAFCSALQLALLRAFLRVQHGFSRAALLAVKLPLWGFALFAVSQWLGNTALFAFGITAGVLFPAASIFVYIRSRKEG